jgi:cell division protease FtsH
MSSGIVALRDIVSAVKAEGGYREWGVAPAFFHQIEKEQGRIHDARNLQMLQSRHALLQLVRMAWENARKSHKALPLGEVKKNVVCTDVYRFATLVFRSVPVLLDRRACEALNQDLAETLQHIRKEGGEGGAYQAHHALVYGDPSVDYWTMPLDLMSAQALMTEVVWELLSSKLTEETVTALLDSASAGLEAILSQAAAANLVAPLSENVQALAENFRIPHWQGMAWFLGAHHAMVQEGIQGRLKALEAFWPSEWLLFLAECEQFVGLETGSLVEVLGNEHTLNYTSLYFQVPKVTADWFNAESHVFHEKNLEELLRFYPQRQGFLNTLTAAKTKEVALDDALACAAFEFLGQDWVNLQALVKASHPLRALVVGEGACGKTSLVKALAAAAGKRLFETEMPPSHTHWFKMNLLGGQQALARAKPAVLLLEGAETVLCKTSSPVEEDIASFLMAGQSREALTSPEIWTIKSLKNVDPAVLSAFDLVVRVGAMPLVQRIALAAQHFEDGLAQQVAQACSTPGEIVALAEWKRSTGLSDWASLSSRLASVQQAVVSTKESAGELPVTIHPPQPGHPGFSDVVGQDNIVRQARRAIAGLRDPAGFKKLGGKVPKGILLKGGPGMGKTHLARAMAAEAGVPLLLADSAAMARSPQLIAAVFAEARRQSPCLLFLDELDAIGTAARGVMGASPDPARQAILNRLLTELSGFTELEGVLVVGATHRSELLDPALIRSGRLGLHLLLEEPTRKAREDIWQHYAKRVACADVINWERLGRISAGMTPADIAQAVDQAVLNAFGDQCDRVGYKHFVEAVDQVLWSGDELELPMVEEERWRTAVHEAGHALLAWHAGQDIERVSIRPRGVALGFVRTLQEEGRYGLAPENIVGQLAMVFGGLAAETVVFGNHTTGVGSDLASARRLARIAVRVAGMEEALPAGVPGPMEQTMSQHLLKECEALEQTMLAKLRKSAVDWLRENQEVLVEFAKRLEEQREMDGEEVQAWLDGRLKRTVEGGAAGFGVMAAAENWPRGGGALAARERAADTAVRD